MRGALRALQPLGRVEVLEAQRVLHELLEALPRGELAVEDCGDPEQDGELEVAPVAAHCFRLG